jgi:hypothetical protein
MTHDGHMAPEEGHEVEQDFEVRSERRSDRKKFEREERDFRGGLLKAILGVLVLLVLLVLVIGGINHYFGDKPEVVKTTEPTATVEPVANIEPDVDDEPLFPDGVHSWAQWEEVATPEMREALEEVAGVTPEQTQKWAAEELAMGKDFQTEVEPGTPIVNTGINDAGWYRVESYKVKEGDTLFLATDKGVAAVKVSCGNPVAPAKPVVTEKPQPAPQPTPQPTKGPNPYPNTVTTHQSSVPVPGPTPGYTPGNAERVVEEQQQSYPTNRTPTPSGTDSGSTTNTSTNSQTTGSDGSKSDATIGNEVEHTPTSGETVPSDDQSGYDPYAIP